MTDDSTAINTAINFARTAKTAVKVVVPRTKSGCLVKSPINLQNFSVSGSPPDWGQPQVDISLGFIQCETGLATFTATASGTTLTVQSGTVNGTIEAPASTGYTIFGAGVPAGTVLTGGSSLTWYTNPATTASSSTITEALPCIDMLGSGFIHFEPFYLAGNSLSTSPSYLSPSYGVQMGRLSTTYNTAADGNFFDHPNVFGTFVVAPFYNLAGENNTWIHPVFQNANVNTNLVPYAWIQDGCNHFNIQSIPGDAAGTMPTNVCNSFNQNTVRGGWITQASASGFPMFIGGARSHIYDGAFLCSGCGISTGTSPGPAAVLLYTQPPGTTGTGGQNLNNVFNVHSEFHNSTGGPSAIFEIAGTTGTPTIQGLTANDHAMNATSAYFVRDTAGTYGLAISNVTLEQASIGFASEATTAPLYDSAASYTVTGNMSIPTVGAWNEPASFSGSVCVLPTSSCTQYVPTLAVNRNPDFKLDQPNGDGTNVNAPSSAGSIITDGWHVSISSNAYSTSVRFQRSTDVPNATVGYYSEEASTTSASTSPTASQYYVMETVVEGPTAQPLAFGTAAAGYLGLDVWLKAYPVAGEYDCFVQNGVGSSASRSFVIPFALLAPPPSGTWQHFFVPIQGDTTSGAPWNVQRNLVGLVFGCTLGAGSSFQTSSPPSGWMNGQIYGTSAAANFMGAATNHFFIAAPHLRFSYFDLPYQPISMEAEIAAALHWYRKSCPSGSLCGQNAGKYAATTIQAQAAYSTALPSLSTQVSFGSPMFSYNNSMPAPLIVSLFSTSAASGNCYDETAGHDGGGSATASNVGDAGFVVSCPRYSSDSVGDIYGVNYTVDSGY
jgi:hypothetical protein